MSNAQDAPLLMTSLIGPRGSFDAACSTTPSPIYFERKVRAGQLMSVDAVRTRLRPRNDRGHRIAGLKPATDGIAGNTSLSRRLRDAQFVTVQFDEDVRTFVVGLDSDRGPSTVVGFIVPIEVNPIDFVIGRTRSHVADEMDEGFPTLADRNSSAAVVLKRTVLYPITSRQHIPPDSVLTRGVGPSRVAVAKTAFAEGFSGRSH